MAKPKSEMNRPRYNIARGGPYEEIPEPATPPFEFQGVTARVFPLKANMARLTLFCDAYLNKDIPKDLVYFRPAIPYVYLMVLNYGKMSVAAENLGWVSQREITFTVPLEWYKQVGDDLVFQDWGLVSPFIFVDDDMSLTTGREVYGWPKVKAWVTAEIDPWASHPRNPRRLMSVSTHVFPKLFAGERQVPRVLLQVDREPTLATSQFPPDLRNRFNPIMSIPWAIDQYLSLVGSAVDIVMNFGVRGYQHEPPRDVGTLLEMFKAGIKQVGAVLPGMLYNLISQGRADDSRLAPDIVTNNITLKQFRDPEQPAYACYQAIVNSKMGIRRFNRGGMLGDAQMLRGDPTGGFEILVHRYESQPVIESLGIEVESEWEADETHVAKMRPVLPFWTDVDLYYGTGEVLCHRVRGKPSTADRSFEELGGEASKAALAEWHKPGEELKIDLNVPECGKIFVENVLPRSVELLFQFHDYVEQADDLTYRISKDSMRLGKVEREKLEKLVREQREEMDRFFGAIAQANGHPEWKDRVRRAVASYFSSSAESCRYNTARGAATQNIAGPFHFPDVTLQVYPLLADRTRLKTFCDDHVNKDLEEGENPPNTRFEPYGTYVYMVVTSYGSQVGRMWSENNNIGWWAEREVAFYVPVKWYKEKKLISVGLLCPYVFADSGRAVATERETNGRPAVKATIDSPPDSWLEESGPLHPRSLLKVKAEVLPALFLGQPSRDATILEIDQELPLRFDDFVGWRQLIPTWGERIAGELKRKVKLGQEHGDACKHLLGLAAEIFAYREPINVVTLKQYRDAKDPQCACYQSLVQVRRTIEQIWDVGEIDDRVDRVHVRLHRYPSQPIADTLGLVIKLSDSCGSDVVDVLQPIRPFWMRVGIKEELGKTICWRSDSRTWTTTHEWLTKPGAGRPPADAAPLGSPYFEGNTPTRVGPALLDKLGEKPRGWELKQRAVRWLDEQPASSGRLTREQAKEAVEAAGDPQVVLENILSCGWGNDNFFNPKPKPICLPNYTFDHQYAAGDFWEKYGFQVGTDKRQAKWWFLDPSGVSASKKKTEKPQPK